MSKKRNQSAPVTPEVTLAPETTVVSTPAPAPAPAPVNPRLMEADKLALDLAKERRQTALAEAKTALAKNENAELAFKYVVLQLYMKYGLTDADAISDTGEIIKNGALQQRPQGQ